MFISLQEKKKLVSYSQKLSWQLTKKKVVGKEIV